MNTAKIIFNGVERTIPESDLDWFVNEKGASLVGGKAVEKTIDKMSVNELKTFLTEKDVEFENDAKKADLLTLAELATEQE